MPHAGAHTRAGSLRRWWVLVGFESAQSSRVAGGGRANGRPARR